MSTTEALRNGDGTTATFTFPFEYLEESDIKVEVDGDLKTQNTHYTFSSLTEITFTAGNIPPSGTGNIRIYRLTDTAELRNEFFAGSAIRAQDLNDDFLQNLYRVQEISERALDSTGGTATGDIVFNNASIVFEGANTGNGFETTVTPKEPAADATITVPNLTGHIAILAADPGSTTISSTPTELNKLNGYTGNHTDLNKIDGVTDGTVAASKAVVVDGNKDIDGFRNVTTSGQISGATGNFSSTVTVATPTADGHAATKEYVDGVALAAIPDSNKGDISVTGSGTTWTIDAGAVTLAKQANLAANSIIGNNTGDAATPTALTATQVRTLLSVAENANNYSHPDHSGDVTSSGDGATTIANDAVTYDKLQNVAANSILGNNTGDAANAIELTAAQVRTLAAAAGTGTVNTFSRTQSVTPEVEATGAIDFTQSNFIELGTGDYSSATVTQTVIGTSGLLYCDIAAPSALPAVLKHPAGTYTAPTAFPAVAPWYQAETDEILVGSWTQGIA